MSVLSSEPLFTCAHLGSGNETMAVWASPVVESSNYKHSTQYLSDPFAGTNSQAHCRQYSRIHSSLPIVLCTLW